jgi:hypothetical protein
LVVVGERVVFWGACSRSRGRSGSSSSREGRARAREREEGLARGKRRGPKKQPPLAATAAAADAAATDDDDDRSRPRASGGCSARRERPERRCRRGASDPQGRGRSAQPHRARARRGGRLVSLSSSSPPLSLSSIARLHFATHPLSRLSVRSGTWDASGHQRQGLGGRRASCAVLGGREEESEPKNYCRAASGGSLISSLPPPHLCSFVFARLKKNSCATCHSQGKECGEGRKRGSSGGRGEKRERREREPRASPRPHPPLFLLLPRPHPPDPQSSNAAH